MASYMILTPASGPDKDHEATRFVRDGFSLPAFLLPEPFTLPQLQRVYEVVLDRPVDKSGFRTRMLAAGFLKEVGYVAGDSNRPALGYCLIDRETPVVFPRTFSPRGSD